MCGSMRQCWSTTLDWLWVLITRILDGPTYQADRLVGGHSLDRMVHMRELGCVPVMTEVDCEGNWVIDLLKGGNKLAFAGSGGW